MKLAAAVMTTSILLGQSKPKPSYSNTQTAKDCAVNIYGKNNSIGNLSCVGINADLATELKSIVHDTNLNAHMMGGVLAQLKEISRHLKENVSSQVMNGSPGASQVQQRTEASNSPNISTNGPNSPVTLGANSPITINPDSNPYAPVVTYDFSGLRRELTPNGVYARQDLEFTVFPQIMKLYQSQDWPRLRDLCEQEMKEAPGWLTPYEFAGLAYLRLDIKNSRGIELLKEVEKRAAGDQHYADATRILNLLNITR